MVAGNEGEARSYEALAEDFRRFSERDSRGSSPLYELLAAGAATDTDVLEIATSVRLDQVVGFSFFGAVHYLLLAEPAHPLARFYHSLTPEPEAPDEAYGYFRAFCLDHSLAIREIVSTRRVQTNEVGRSSFILPSLAYAAQLGGDRPVAIVEAGASAGMNLLPDHFFFDYGRLQWGNPESKVRIHCAIDTEALPPLQLGRPRIAFRAGMELLPIDLENEREVRWLRATVWPDHRERTANLQHAIEIGRSKGLHVIGGDAADHLIQVASTVPPELTLCVFQTYALNQFPPESRARFMAGLGELAAQRPLYFISTEGQGSRPRRTPVTLSHWVNGIREARIIAEGEIHGALLSWLA